MNEPNSEDYTENVPQPRVCDDTDEAKVYAWLYDKGPCPDDAAFCAQLIHLAVEWKVQRKEGLEIVASKMIDVLSELSTAMKDL